MQLSHCTHADMAEREQRGHKVNGLVEEETLHSAPSRVNQAGGGTRMSGSFLLRRFNATLVSNLLFLNCTEMGKQERREHAKTLVAPLSLVTNTQSSVPGERGADSNKGAGRRVLTGAAETERQDAAREKGVATKVVEASVGTGGRIKVS